MGCGYAGDGVMGGQKQYLGNNQSVCKTNASNLFCFVPIEERMTSKLHVRGTIATAFPIMYDGAWPSVPG